MYSIASSNWEKNNDNGPENIYNQSHSLASRLFSKVISCNETTCILKVSVLPKTFTVGIRDLKSPVSCKIHQDLKGHLPDITSDVKTHPAK